MNTDTATWRSRSFGAGYAPDVPSVWVLQDIGALDVERWNALAEECGDLMCAGSEVVAPRAGWPVPTA